MGALSVVLQILGCVFLCSIVLVGVGVCGLCLPARGSRRQRRDVIAEAERYCRDAVRPPSAESEGTP